MNDKGIISIKTGHIYPHPDNPRKDLGDLSELIESIKKNGIMQNLTVIPHEVNPGEYIAIIGHRRHAAALQAGIEEVPCRIIESMTVKEQVSMMLEENMQRNDLTIYEQAQGFQMMMDLGETEVSIAEKTGFSRTTIRHRLNIAKLNQKELQKKEKDDNFQLTMKDLVALEKVEDIKTRNKILKEANSSRDLVNRAQNAVSEAKRESNAKIIEGMLKKLGVEKAPKGAENEMYSGKWKTVKEFELEKEVPKQIELPKKKEPVYYLIQWRMMKVITKGPKEKKELSTWEQEQKQKDKAKREIKAILKESSARRKELIQNIISGKVDAVKDKAKEIELIWQALVLLGAGIYDWILREVFLEKNEYNCTDEEKKEARKQVDGLSTLHQMLIILDKSMVNTNETFDYNLNFNQTKGNALLKGYEALEPYGWYFEDDNEKKVLDGTHELYAKEKGDN